jgi:hypothetical protein
VFIGVLDFKLENGLDGELDVGLIDFEIYRIGY